MPLKTAAALSQALSELERELLLSTSHLKAKRGALHELRLKLDEVERNFEYHVKRENAKKKQQEPRTGFTNLGEESDNEGETNQ